ncbi:hypothetical protein, partial [Bacillus wiedmannii]
EGIAQMHRNTGSYDEALALFEEAAETALDCEALFAPRCPISAPTADASPTAMAPTAPSCAASTQDLRWCSGG